MGKLTFQTKFGVAPNDLLNLDKLSFKAKGLYTYLNAKPSGWSFSIERISKQSKDGLEAVRSGLQELEKVGYLKRIPTKDDKGKWSGYDYILYSFPSSDNPSSENPTTDNPYTLSKKDSNNKDIVKKKNSSKKKGYYNGMEIRQAQGKTWCIPPDGGTWLEFADSEDKIDWK